MARYTAGALDPRRRAAVTGLALMMMLVATTARAPGARAADDHRQAVDISFPVAGSVWFSDDYVAQRGNGARRHQATDIFSAKGTPLHAAADGVVCRLEGASGPMPSYGYLLAICGDDGRQYGYHHLNNDRPGTDDGLGGPTRAFAAGIREGQRVSRGQLVGYLGDSGNAEDTPPHLHFVVMDPRLRDPRLEPDPWIQGRVNPYASLVAAQRRGDVPGATASNRSLRLESPYRRGEDVRELQRNLASLGYTGASGRPLVADGVFGRDTDAAVRQFQTGVGIDAIGVVGPQTRGALTLVLAGGGAGAAPPPPTPAPSTPAPSTPVPSSDPSAWPGRYLTLTDPHLRGSDVRAFQSRLAALGYRDPAGAPLVADGVWGPQTDRAARRFIADAGLPAVPIVGPRTWERAFGD